MMARLTSKDLGVNVQTTKKYLSEIENLIERLEDKIRRLHDVIEMTENALKNIEDDKYYKIIELKYFEEMTLEYIALGRNITAFRERYSNFYRYGNNPYGDYELKQGSDKSIMDRIADICVSMKSEDYIE